MKFLTQLFLLSLLLSCRSHSNEQLRVQDVPEERKGEEKDKTGEVVSPVQPEGHTPEKADQPRVTDEDWEVIIASSNHGTGVGNGTIAYENTLCGLIRVKGEGHILEDWAGKPVASLTLDEKLRALLTKDPERACIVDSQMPREDDPELRRISPKALFRTEADKRYPFIVYPYPGKLGDCVKAIRAEKIVITAIHTPVIQDPFIHVLMPDQGVGTLQKQACVMMISPVPVK